MTRQEFFSKYASTAKAVTAGTPIFPGVVLAVAALESGNGNSKLTKEANNYFGIKAFSSWKGDKYSIPTKEYIDGEYVTVPADFRKYKNATESFQDYVNLITKTSRYKKATEAKTATAQLEAIKEAGYSTDPKYVTKVASVIAEIKEFAADVKKKPGRVGEQCLQSFCWV